MIDLHMHSNYSDDGEFTPVELVEQCAAQGVDLMSITDHNCAKANKEAKAAAKEKGIRYISGIEIDCTYEGANFHVLGYGIDDTSLDFIQAEEAIRKQSRNASLDMLAKTRELGFLVEEKEMRKLGEKIVIRMHGQERCLRKCCLRNRNIKIIRFYSLIERGEAGQIMRW